MFIIIIIEMVNVYKYYYLQKHFYVYCNEFVHANFDEYKICNGLLNVSRKLC